MPERTARSGRPRRHVLAAVAFCALVVLTGCGVSASGAPLDIGDAANVGGAIANDGVKQPDGPSTGGTPEKLVQLFLQAAAGGDNSAPGRLREFLTGAALDNFREPDRGQAQALPLNIIRLIGDPVTRLAVPDRRAVDIRYQVVGILNDQGIVNGLPGYQSAEIHDMTFYVVADDKNNNRIDEIEGKNIPSGLLLSSDALLSFYRPQPIYFWDSNNANARLVPDLRYLPLTLTPDQRAQRVVQWLLVGPSPWLSASAQHLAVGTAIKEGITNQNGTWAINLSAPGGAGGAEAVKRLYYQLQWSLRVASYPSVALSIEGKPQQIGGAPDDYLQFNLSSGLDQARQQRYDIVNGAVVAVPGNGPQPNVLKAPDNKNVVYAGVNRGADTAALVRTGPDGKRYLEIVRDSAPGHVVTGITKTGSPMGRPAWIPGTSLVVVPAAGRVWLVQANGDASDITPAGRSGITSLAVAPDGRRIAWIEGDNAFVAGLIWDGTNMNIGLTPQPVMANQLSARAIAWTSEAWLNVVGAAANGKSAMFQATVDCAVAKEVTGGTLDALTDVVALADGPAQKPGQVLLSNGQGWSTSFGTNVAPERELKNPFYVS